MKKIVILLFLLFAIDSKAQNNFQTDFLNDVTKEIIPQDLEYYNLFNSSFLMDLDKYTLYEERNKLKKSYPDFQIEDFLKIKDSTIYKWDNLKLEKAKYYNNYEDLPRHLNCCYTSVKLIYDPKIKQSKIDSLNSKTVSHEIYIKIKAHWNEKKIREKIDKAWKRNDSQIKKENKIYYIFSTPEFSNDKKYAIISVKVGPRSSKYLFQKTDTGWIKIFEFDFTIA